MTTVYCNNNNNNGNSLKDLNMLSNKSDSSSIASTNNINTANNNSNNIINTNIFARQRPVSWCSLSRTSSVPLDVIKDSLVASRGSTSVVERIQTRQRETLNDKIRTMRLSLVEEPKTTTMMRKKKKEKFRMPTLVISKGTPMLSAFAGAAQKRRGDTLPAPRARPTSLLVTCSEVWNDHAIGSSSRSSSTVSFSGDSSFLEFNELSTEPEDQRPDEKVTTSQGRSGKVTFGEEKDEGAEEAVERQRREEEAVAEVKVVNVALETSKDIKSTEKKDDEDDDDEEEEEEEYESSLTNHSAGDQSNRELPSDEAPPPATPGVSPRFTSSYTFVSRSRPEAGGSKPATPSGDEGLSRPESRGSCRDDDDDDDARVETERVPSYQGDGRSAPQPRNCFQIFLSERGRPGARLSSRSKRSDLPSPGIEFLPDGTRSKIEYFGEPTSRDSSSGEPTSRDSSSGEPTSRDGSSGEPILKSPGEPSLKIKRSDASSRNVHSSDVVRPKIECSGGLDQLVKGADVPSPKVKHSGEPTLRIKSSGLPSPPKVDISDVTGAKVKGSSDPTQIVKEVVVNRGPFSLGFCIEGGRGSPLGDRPISVKRLFKGDTSVRGILEPGDVIVSVNGHDLEGMTHFQAWNLLKIESDGPMVVKIRRSLETN